MSKTEKLADLQAAFTLLAMLCSLILFGLLSIGNYGVAAWIAAIPALICHTFLECRPAVARMRAANKEVQESSDVPAAQKWDIVYNSPTENVAWLYFGIVFLDWVMLTRGAAGLTNCFHVANSIRLESRRLETVDDSKASKWMFIAKLWILFTLVLVALAIAFGVSGLLANQQCQLVMPWIMGLVFLWSLWTRINDARKATFQDPSTIKSLPSSMVLWSWIAALAWAWHFIYGPHANVVFAVLFVAMAVVQSWRWWIYKKLEEKGRVVA